MARLNRFGFLAVAIVFHLIYVYSIFDIYFVSPIVSGMRQFGVERPEGHDAPAERLVLFVGDGLRADKAFQSFPDPYPSNPDLPNDPRPLAPFLRSRVISHGTFGVSHTRVPTESRPGHVALIAGLYEDVSAVMTGWKLNPVNFDSVFNRSRHTWSWGSPDILPMFKEGAVEGRVDADTYGEEAEDYTKDATHLDTWVFDKVKSLFASAATDPALNSSLREDKLVFFLHLLGLDMTGHAYRPYSPEYLYNIKIVDQGVQEITHLIEEFYDDGKTAFVFTADHGMSDWGSHGDGNPDNTRTPLIAWGSGVAEPSLTSGEVAEGHGDTFSSDWGLDHVRRNDVSQADVAALMAYLVGLDFPVNSVGRLPLQYLAGDIKEKAEASLVNVRGVLEMYRVKEEQKRAKEIRYKPFSALGDEEHSVDHRVAVIRSLIDNRQYEESIRRCDDLMEIGLEGLRYLQTYDWLFLRALVTLGYLGWIAFALTTVVDLHVLYGKSETARTIPVTILFVSTLVGLYAVLWTQQSSWTYYAYAVFPVAFWEEVAARRRAVWAGRNALFGNIKSVGGYTSLAIKSIAFIGLLEAIPPSSNLMRGHTAAFWPASYGRVFLSQNRILIATWSLACVLMSTFTMLPVVKVENSNTILVGGALMFGVGVLYLLFEKSILSHSIPSDKGLSSASLDGFSRVVLGLQIGLIALAMIVTKSSIASLQAKQGLPLGNQVLGWIILVTSLTIPFLHGLWPNSHYLHRLVVIFLSFAPVFVILTISYEGLFYLVFCTTLVTWVRLEHHIYAFTTSQQPADSSSSPPIEDLKSLEPALAAAKYRLPSLKEERYRALTLSDARIALFFLFLLQSAFFSTGNIASVSSFSLDSVYRLIPVFNPFSQGALLIFKIMIPFAVISANLGVLNRRLGVAPSALFMVVMAISDVLTLNFFFMVRDEGSWLDIGTSISHFVIASLLCVFVAGLEFVSEVFVAGVDVGDRRDGRKEEGQEKAELEVNGEATSNGSVPP
ncbi:MAG: Glycosyl phosphatidyl inositol anchor synthesis [Candelina submexicana]|nr:MAG: Glycosyl phosphatidyl inositol anchor synthesis [Candelina submexicana]